MAADRWLVAGGFVLWFVSLALPAIVGSGFPAFSGLDVLRQGAGAFRDGVVAWYANPALLVAFAACWLRWYRTAASIALVGLLLAVSSFGAGPMAEASGRSVPAFSYGAGFYVWLVAFVCGLAAPLAGIYKESGAKKST
jgi:hypothetical protein